ncbi:FMN-dependent NADH-azoreductase [Sphingomicrobium astaxanthinifaciens]|uniref:FMN-dependent NADH-azoreductase n=1 Tax=Sphingomicrobium astaxanthinifaciens TaxID=1227949 RepID=UPI001FCB6B7E|nr:NAD(P)H-dependent oxidoreductase [Sphingomicrobium astaxanthinifaciens]MCJ7420766.1 NAD(P)H-dependent oxidoreductase [Sphingomicrobium astaxanthinifaciens]
MTTLLHIDSSTQGADSVTRALTAHAVERLADGATTVERLDLVADPIPHLLGRPEDNRWVRQFMAADTIVIGAPTYNFTVPTQLKAWFDRIALAGTTFRYGDNGPEGLVGDKRVIVAIASGGNYEDGSAFEHNKSYVQAFFQFLGVEPRIVAARGVALSPTAKAEAIAAARAEIDQLAAALEPVRA